jgi:hypothetical protein
MTDDPRVERKSVEPLTLQSLAATAGVPLTADRAAALALQAEPHFALLRDLDAIAGSSTEPAAELHLEQWTRPASD